MLISLIFVFWGNVISFSTPVKIYCPIIREVIAENDCCDCNYRLYVETCTGFWYLKLKNDCPNPIIATCKYTIYYDDGTHKSYSENVRLNGNWETIIASGNMDHSSCTADGVSANYAQ